MYSKRNAVILLRMFNRQNTIISIQFAVSVNLQQGVYINCAGDKMFTFVSNLNSMNCHQWIRNIMKKKKKKRKRKTEKKKKKEMFVCLLVAYRPSNMLVYLRDGSAQTSFTCCHTETEVADKTFHLTQSQYTDTRSTSPSADHISPGAWQGSHWNANYYMTQSGKILSQVGSKPPIFRSQGECLNH